MCLSKMAIENDSSNNVVIIFQQEQSRRIKREYISEDHQIFNVIVQRRIDHTLF